VIATFSAEELYLVPVPNAEALTNVESYRTLKMVQEAFNETAYDGCALDALRWNKKRRKAHEGGSRKREDLFPLLDAVADVKDKNVVLIDEIVTTGGNLLASQDRLIAAGAKIVAAVTCGRSVYDLKDPPFKARSFELAEQLKDYQQSG